MHSPLDKSSSDAHTVVVRIDFDASLGTYEIYIAGERLDWGKSVEQALFQFEAGQPADFEALLSQILAHPHVQRRHRLLVTGDHESRDFFAQTVRRLTKNSRFSVDTTSDPALAVSKKSHAAVARRRAEVYVVEDRLDPLVDEALNQVQESTGSSDLVLIIGVNNAEFIRQIYALGNGGALQGRYVILAAACSRELPRAIDRILNKFGALGVFSFKEPIRQRVLPPLRQGLQQRLSREGPDIDDVELQRLIQETVDDIGDSTLEDWNFQV